MDDKPESPVNKWWPSILKSLPMIVITADQNGVISYINHVLPEFTPEKVIGTPVFNYIPRIYLNKVNLLTLQSPGRDHREPMPGITL
jgi:hypothetical protein